MGQIHERPDQTRPFAVYLDDLGRQVPVVYVHSDSAIGGGSSTEEDMVLKSRSYSSVLSNQNFGVMGGSTHQRRLFLPLGGQWIKIRHVWEAPPGWAAWEVNRYSVCSGRQYAESEPRAVGGGPAAYQSVKTAFMTNSGLSALSLNTIVETHGQWFYLYVIPDATYPGWGTVIMRSRNTTSGQGAGRVWGTSNGKIALLNSITARYKETFEYAAATTDVDSQSFVLTSPSDPNDVNRNLNPFNFEILLPGQCFTVCYSGDSRAQGDGSTGNLWSWMNRSCEKVTIAKGIPVALEGHYLSGQSHETFSTMMADRLSKSLRVRPDLAVLQGGSTNGSTWTDFDIYSAILRNLDHIDTCKRLRIKPGLVSLYPSVGATNSDQVARWVLLNNWILNSGVDVFDMYGRPEFTTGAAIPALPQNTGINADAAHLNNTGHELAANLVGVPRLIQILGL